MEGDPRQLRRDMIFMGRFPKEVDLARDGFPSNQHQVAALGEEVGELQEALIEHEYGNASAQDVWEEAVQVAAMAMRVATEGDQSFDYDPEKALEEISG